MTCVCVLVVPDYDGGDCCECDCQAPTQSDDFNQFCDGGFECIDPNSGCVDQEPDDETERCSDEVIACFDDTTCAACLMDSAWHGCPLSDSSDDDSSTSATCSDMEGHFCCYYGDTCSTNALVLAYQSESLKKTRCMLLFFFTRQQ